MEKTYPVLGPDFNPLTEKMSKEVGKDDTFNVLSILLLEVLCNSVRSRRMTGGEVDQGRWSKREDVRALV